MENAEISGVEYQQGELQGYEVREYLLEKWGRATPDEQPMSRCSPHDFATTEPTNPQHAADCRNGQNDSV